MRLALPLLPILGMLVLPACSHGGGDSSSAHGHSHADGSHSHETESAGSTPATAEEGHEHAAEPLGSVQIGELLVELSQGHGAVTAGEESHLVVKLPYSDKGSTTIRAWVGSEDRTLSYVGKGEYAADHDDYDIHVTAPDPLPANAMWWIEIERPDGSRVLGWSTPLR